MNRVTVVGFDLDMTLVDSATGIAATLRTALAEVGVAVTPERLWPWVGVPLDGVLAQVAPDVDVDAVVARYRALYPVVGVPSITPLPGAREALDAVEATGGRVVIVSAKVADTVRAVLEHVHLAGNGESERLVVGGLFAAAKGTALREHGASVYVGDHPGDVEAARAGGALSVAVATGPHGAQALRDRGRTSSCRTSRPSRAGWPATCGGPERRPASAASSRSLTTRRSAAVSLGALVRRSCRSEGSTCLQAR